MQGGALHGDPAHVHGVELRPRHDGPGAPHVHPDVAQQGGGRGGRELVGDGPSGGARHRPQPPLHLERVHLDHRAVDVVVEVAPALLPGITGGGHRIDVVVDGDEGVHREARLAQPRQHVLVAHGTDSVGGAHRIEPGAQRALRREAGVELPQAARGGVAGVRERGQPLGRPGLVELREGLEGQVHLAPHLHALRRGADAVAQHQGHGHDGADVGGDVLAHLAVTARGAHREAPVLIGEGDGQAVDLGLHHVAHGAPGHALLLEHRGEAAVPLAQFLIATGVRQAEHRLQVTMGREPAGRLRPHALGGRIGGHQVGVRGLDLLQFAHPRVVDGVVHRGVVPHVVPVRRIADEAAQLGGAAGGVSHPCPASGTPPDPARRRRRRPHRRARRVGRTPSSRRPW